LQFMGDSSGFFFMWPGMRGGCSNCGTYDPRLRPWYSQALVGARTLVLLLDATTNMAQDSMVYFAREAALMSLKTVGANDHLVAMFVDSDGARIPSVEDGFAACFETSASKATPQIIKQYRRYLESYPDAIRGGSPNWVAAWNMVAAFGLSGPVAVVRVTATSDSSNVQGGLLAASGNNGLDPYYFTHTVNGAGARLDCARCWTLDHTDGSGLLEEVPKYFFELPRAPALPVMTPPYLDFTTKSLVLSLVQRLPDVNGLERVTGLDIVFSTVVQDALYAAEELSYSFILERNGLTLAHPLVPAPAEFMVAGRELILLDIGDLERHPAFQPGGHIREKIASGTEGTETLEVEKVTSLGPADKVGARTQTVTMTYSWKAVEGTDIVAVFAVQTGVERQSIDMDTALREPENGDMYDRMVRDPHGNHMVYLSPSSFEEPGMYLASVVDMTDQEKAQINAALKDGSRVVEPFGIKDEAITDQAVTRSVSECWGNPRDATFIGTWSGVFRMQPAPMYGMADTMYNPTGRTWFHEAVASSESEDITLTVPYEDYNTKRLILSVCKAIKHGNEVRAVLGRDLELDVVKRALVTACGPTSSDTCYAVTAQGYIVSRNDDWYDDDVSYAHLANQKPEIVRALVAEGLMKIDNNVCLRASEGVTHVTYGFTNVGDETHVVAGSTDCGSKYSLTKVPGVALYLVAESKGNCPENLCEECTADMCQKWQKGESVPDCVSVPCACAFEQDICNNRFEGGWESTPLCPADPTTGSAVCDTGASSYCGAEEAGETAHAAGLAMLAALLASS